jgi:hypothetical protein
MQSIENMARAHEPSAPARPERPETRARRARAQSVELPDPVAAQTEIMESDPLNLPTRSATPFGVPNVELSPTPEGDRKRLPTMSQSIAPQLKSESRFESVRTLRSRPRPSGSRGARSLRVLSRLPEPRDVPQLPPRARAVAAPPPPAMAPALALTQ